MLWVPTQAEAQKLESSLDPREQEAVKLQQSLRAHRDSSEDTMVFADEEPLIARPRSRSRSRRSISPRGVDNIMSVIEPGEEGEEELVWSPSREQRNRSAAWQHERTAQARWRPLTELHGRSSIHAYM